MIEKNVIFVKELYKKYAGLYDIQIKMQCDIIEYLYNNGYNGDVLEIGAYVGNHTVEFLKITKKYNKKVYVVDPYDGNQEGNQDICEKFLHNTANYDNLIFIRNASQSTNVFDLLKNVNFNYIFIDGLHNMDALYSDILLSYNSLVVGGIICVDDINMVDWKSLIKSFQTTLSDLMLITKPDIIYDNYIKNNIKNRLEIVNNNDFGIYNPGHKEIEFLIKK